ncbi:hypothetical protein K8B33_03975 [Alcanivorax sp. JB21]|uniref:hypothetical protein n=1 Tax=Alcanivorax limicola TaxID=2874102 RepID=UPI001CBF3E98|nr:hypothetical protein [Alcanivorax limicola]MBZ2188239.1 hypothetical protein [Alcanivorax limicola]
MADVESRSSDSFSSTDSFQMALEYLRQNRLLAEAEFLHFTRKCGLPIKGVVRGDPGDFLQRGWLNTDGVRGDGEPLFHPFRIYVAHKLLCILRPVSEEVDAVASSCNRIVDIAVLLEPLYWPLITDKVTWPGAVSEDEHATHLQEYRPKVLELVRALNPEEWKVLHENLRQDAASVDDNPDLYLLLRLSTWSARENLKGKVAAGVWFRHMAEVLRRAFEEVHGASWPEEDNAFGVWMKGARTLAYGSETPLENLAEARHHVAVNFGLITGSVVRWYVEGDTEYHAVLTLLPEPGRCNIELVNLKGNLASGKGNIALKLEDGLFQDRKLRRFSFLSFDMDVAANVKLVRRQVEQGRIVGHIAAHQPDFEFANFDLKELLEVAARIDEKAGFSADDLRRATWSDVSGGRQFERRYMEVSKRRQSLKGEEWGKALAEYAADQPERDGSERPFLAELKAALRARQVKYDQHRDEYSYDPASFKIVPKRKS